MPQIHPSRLVIQYLAEASQCLKSKLSLASIGMSWAAIDYAIEYEVLAHSVKFNPRKFETKDKSGKLDFLWQIHPEMRGAWRNKILIAYNNWRNPYLHARAPSLDLYEQCTEVFGKTARLVAHDGQTHDLNNLIADKSAAGQTLLKELHILGSCDVAALACYKIAANFVHAIGSPETYKEATLQELNQRFRQRAATKNSYIYSNNDSVSRETGNGKC